MQSGIESDNNSATDWLQPIRVGFGPRYMQVVRMIEEGIARGVLQPGTQLPTQRALAQLLGIDVSTASRAYTAAHKQGLISATTGRGTFIAQQETASWGYEGTDLGLNIPPIPDMLNAALKDGLTGVLQTHQLPQLSTYEPFAIHAKAIAQGRLRLTPYLPQAATQPLMLAAGTQSGLFAILVATCRAGDAVLCDPLTYPGFLSAARKLGLRVLAVKGDEQGMLPDALRNAIQANQPKLLYLNPTLHNPTTRTMPLERRQAIAACLHQTPLVVIEDDPYRELLPAAPPPLVTMLPPSVHSYYLATLSKSVWPSLRTSFVLASDMDAADTVQDTLRAVGMGLSPLLLAVTVQWLENGTAAKMTAHIQQEAQMRQSLARQLLPDAAVADPHGLHIWLPLPPHWSEDAFVHALHERGLAVAGAQAFSARERPEGAVRLSLGVTGSIAKLEQALRDVAQVYAQRQAPVLRRSVV